MKKFLTVVSTLLLAGSLAFAQNTGGDKKPKTDNPQGSNTQGTATTTAPSTTSGKKGHKGGKKGHKGGKKSKKGNGTTNTPPPK